jgi:hypothetical protein
MDNGYCFISFSVLNSMGLLLKVLSGARQGAEFDIPEKEIVIVAADECDIMMNEALVADRYAKFGYSEGRIFTTPLDGNLSLDRELLRKPTTVDNFNFITIGATHMTMGEAESECWQTVSLGEFPEVDKIEGEVTTFSESLGPATEAIEEDPINRTKKIRDQETEDIKETELKNRQAGIFEEDISIKVVSMER